MKKTASKNNALEFYRALFTFVICLHHSQYFISKQDWLKHAYICVEFFFILSGYLLYSSFSAEKEHSTLGYVTRRLKRLYPEYVPAAVLMILAEGVFLRDFDLSKVINELMMVQNTGLFHLGGYNYACWYIPVMLLCGTLLYSVLSLWHTQFRKFWAPVLVIAGYTYIWGLDTGIENWQYIGCVSVPMIRGICGMTLGILAGWLNERDLLRNVGMKLGTVIEIASLALIAVGLTTDISTDMLSIVSFAALILVTVGQKGYLGKVIFSGECWSVLGAYTYGAYLNHAIIVYVLSYINNHIIKIPHGKLLIFTAVLAAYTFLSRTVILRLTRMIGNGRNRGKSDHC